MEDAHIADTDVTPPSTFKNNAKVFCVFDGHGGAEVARFCQLYLVDVLVNQEHWKGDNVDIGKSLTNAFHEMDTLIDDPERRDEIIKLQLEKPHPRERRAVADSSNRTGSTAIDNGGCCNHEGGSIKVINDTEMKDNDDDSDVQIGDIGEDRLDNNGVEEEQSDTIDISSQDTSSLFQKLLAIRQSIKFESLKNDTSSDANSDSSLLEMEMEFKATKILNGRQVCNLPDHPIHAGCTAVCAVITDGLLTVANAGDSRVVLCRGDGVTEAMSFDHKPIHDIEMNRITEAGGFVNAFGRVNGNLNLSRSIGDLKYKQVPMISPSAQMITAEPDIKQVTLNADDEFIILACDGIWDCLTNEEAVKFVLDRIDTQTPKEIGIEMLDSIISIDPRVTQGIGGDNMTVMIVDLKPETRSWRKKEQQN